MARRTAPALRRLRPVTDFVAPLGSLVLGCIAGCFALAAIGHWGEFALIGWLLVLVALLCVALTIGRTRLVVGLALEPLRVRAGELAHGRVDVHNVRRGRLLPVALEVPVGAGVGRFNLPSLAGDAHYVDYFEVPTTRRGVIPIGPVTTVRGDPFGLAHRTMRWTETVELFVHPRLTGLDSIDSGLLRDLEGRTTNDLSMSDLAFHTLREYEPGDDRRYIHWRSSAKASAGNPNSKFLVRQFLDTRRSHLCVVVDADDLSYEDPQNFELAISCAASVAVRAIRDEIQTTVVIADQIVHEGTSARTLDAFARAQADRTPMSMLTGSAVRVAPGTSIALLVTGSSADFSQIRKAAANFSIDVATVVLRISPDQPVGISSVFGMTLLSITDLADLPRVLAAQVLQ